MGKRKSLNRWSTFFHKWLGLTIGIQVLLWITSGLVMVWWDIEVIRSEHNIAEPTPIEFTADYPLVPINMVLQGVNEPVREVKLKTLVTLPVYEVTFDSGRVELFHASGSKQLTPLPAEAALVIAQADYAGQGTPTEAEWLTETNTEYRSVVPVWKIDMLDAEGTHIYVSPQTGGVVARRSDIWRFFDFFWMLHIMDYENRTDFNNPLVIWSSIFAFIFTITGVIMLFFRFKKRDFGLS
jgi:uncharacterized iron-regulated membrane protein